MERQWESVSDSDDVASYSVQSLRRLGTELAGWKNSYQNFSFCLVLARGEHFFKSCVYSLTFKQYNVLLNRLLFLDFMFGRGLKPPANKTKMQYQCTFFNIRHNIFRRRGSLNRWGGFTMQFGPTSLYTSMNFDKLNEVNFTWSQSPSNKAVPSDKRSWLSDWFIVKA